MQVREGLRQLRGLAPPGCVRGIPVIRRSALRREAPQGQTQGSVSVAGSSTAAAVD